MISIGYAILLGIIQGLTEFLPVSSSAHLTLAGSLLHLIDPDHPEDWTAYIAIIQIGTIAAVIIYFFKDLLRMTHAALADARRRNGDGAPGWGNDSRMLGNIIIGTLPVAVIGLAFKKIIEGMFTKEISTIATSMIAVALLLLLAEFTGKRKRSEGEITWIDALVIGFAQSCALIPGSSRSGSTITAGLFLGLTREAAARFSFLLSIPAVLASGFFEMYEARHHMASLGILPLAVSTIVSGIVGYATIAFLLGYLKTHSTKIFVVYRILLGSLLWILLLRNVL
ncbi:MAG TPA: undecaprenyl-diphosphatase UppP [Bacteroidota bacterium]|nr:undecaprenyl-diphosphatase UppP [Bacteroidota bacterium]